MIFKLFAYPATCFPIMDILQNAGIQKKQKKCRIEKPNEVADNAISIVLSTTFFVISKCDCFKRLFTISYNLAFYQCCGYT